MTCIGIIETLRKSIDVVPSHLNNLLQLHVTSKDPRKAARIANALAMPISSNSSRVAIAPPAARRIG